MSLFLLHTHVVHSLFFLNIEFSLAIFCGCTASVVSDLVGNPQDRFSHDEAHGDGGVCTTLLSV